jgi:hypothetical protein
VGVQLGFQAVAVLIEDEIHAALGAAGFFVEAAAGLRPLARCRAEGNLFAPAEVDRLPTDHAGLPFSLASRRKQPFLNKDIATSLWNLRRKFAGLGDGTNMESIPPKRRCDFDFV